MDARFTFTFCDDKLCAIDAVLNPPKSTSEVAAFRYAVRELENALGPPTKSAEEAHYKCRAVSSFYDCVSNRHAKINASWRFQAGDSIKVEWSPNEATKQAELHVVYRQSKKSRRKEARVGSSASAAEPQAAPRACTPGQSVACTGPRRCEGYQVCSTDGSHFGDCICE